MRVSTWLPTTGVLLLCLCAGSAAAQSRNQCPTLPADAGVQWHVVDGDDFIFCRAVDSSTGEQAFAVSIGRSAQFKPRRGTRIGERVTIDGSPVYWHEGDVALAPNLLIRETLVELDSGDYAHIIVRAQDQARLAKSLADAQSLRFSGQHLGGR
ncbi:hypothetical protein LDO26_10490 [Luteimonas sp. BDR2-5]|uniref:hypothetical protein n=1 Tax=Proluteimonas luteida TaxID=2878685 RepID=UPI001E416432|nr:hypothetical protein [Luteimonas sp. BDR2-5]MCD9028632.1 hypothetical protein [Luteimonas sp. BDR2-5]